jgi:peptidoglycan/LPS O-acetylase OafA/YrhL
MGVFRMLLALCVLFSHSVPSGSLNHLAGGFAVEAFFVISGFYMALVLSERYTKERLGRPWLARFYLSRYLRLYPAYLLSALALLLLDLVASLLFHRSVGHLAAWRQMLALPPTPGNLLLILWAAVSNLTIFLMDLALVIAVRGHQAVFTFFRTDAEINVWALPFNNLAWSLGVELTFYALAPLLIRKSNRQLLLLALLAVLLKIYAIVRLDYDLPYRLFPLVFIDFLLGVLAYRLRSVLIHIGGRHGAVIAYCLMLALTAALPRGLADWQYSFLAIGVTALVVPVLFEATKNSLFDNRVGELSYPFYLFHVLAVYLVRFALIKTTGVTNAYTISVCNISVTLLIVHFVLQLEARFIEPYRRQLGRVAPTAPLDA